MTELARVTGRARARWRERPRNRGALERSVPPSPARLGVWWVVALAIVVGVAWAATDHFLRATVTLAVGCLVGALLRLVLPPERAGGLVIRSRVADVLVLTVLGVALLATGFALDLRARV